MTTANSSEWQMNNYKRTVFFSSFVSLQSAQVFFQLFANRILRAVVLAVLYSLPFNFTLHPVPLSLLHLSCSILFLSAFFCVFLSEFFTMMLLEEQQQQCHG